MKNFYLVISTLLSLALANSLYAQPGLNRKLSLKEAVELAIKNNLVIKQSGLNAEAGKINLQQARANRYPYFDGSINHGIQQGRSIEAWQ